MDKRGKCERNNWKETVEEQSNGGGAFYGQVVTTRGCEGVF